MKRFSLACDGNRVELSDGEILVGRGMDCLVRLNDSTVSRVHLRIVVNRGRAVAVNLSPNGTLINRKPLTRPRDLVGDELLQIGRCTVVVVADDDEFSGPTAVDRDQDTQPPLDEANYGNVPGDFLSQLSSPSVERARSLTPRTMAALSRPACPRCRQPLATDAVACNGCGYQWPHGHPSRPTQRINVLANQAARRSPVAFEVPIIYCSSQLNINSAMRYLSREGVFLNSREFDAVGTSCEVTMLPQGHPAVQFTGRVAEVRDDEASRSGMGMFIHFDDANERARAWLDHVLGPRTSRTI